ncbi:hypothetical protein ACQX0D_11275 [Corynebacterium diphtheriae]
MWQVRAALPPLLGAPECVIDAEVAVTHNYDDRLFAQTGCRTIAAGVVTDIAHWEYGRVSIGGDTFMVDEEFSLRASLHRPRVYSTRTNPQAPPALASHLLGCAVWTVMAEASQDTTRLGPGSFRPPVRGGTDQYGRDVRLHRANERLPGRGAVDGAGPCSLTTRI